MQWSFSNKSSSPNSQFLSFKSPQEEKSMMRTGFDGYMTISTANEVMQKNTSLRKQGGGNYGMTNYSQAQYDSHLVHRPAISTPIIHSAGQIIGGSPVNNPSAGAVVGHTDLRNGSRTSAAPKQLTIFYDGMVCVFDGISPEKAQAIMLLAGNGTPVAPKAPTLPIVQLQAKMCLPPTTSTMLTSTSSTANAYLLSQSHSNYTSPRLTLSRNISLPNSLNNTVSRLSRRTDNNNNNNNMNKLSPNPVTSPSTTCTILESSRVVRPQLQPLVHPTFNQNAVPQARKASLARFLEKRKERATGVAPYVLPDPTTSSASGNTISFHSAGSSLLPATT
jgi:jasmonate ZIM domain-containing protein